MLTTISCGDLDLNLNHPIGTPTLVPGKALEAQLDVRRLPEWQSENSKDPPTKLAVHIHIHYTETIDCLLAALNKVSDGLGSFDLWISTNSTAKAELIKERIHSSLNQAMLKHLNIRICGNRGRNLAPLLIDLWSDLQTYDLLLHLHGKRSLESDLGQPWLEELLNTLLPDSCSVLHLRQTFSNHPSLGLVMPAPPELIRPYLNWGTNFELASQFSQLFAPHRPLRRDALLSFPAGMMFWAKPAALMPLAHAMAQINELPPEPLAIDGSSLHALERLVSHSCEQAEHTWKLIHKDKPASHGDLQRNISAWEPQPLALQDGLATLAHKLRQEMERSESAETKLNNCAQQLKSSNEQLQQADVQLQQADGQLRELSAELHAIKRSLSWKLTRLLRWLSKSQ
ncbi:rhamnan synthesis F family protein [Prochlorococcus marinus]|uniref:rhamnan synthesis F family protein n=1 Tax=Prochlorococcus TaxID=1218 RepID=UPI0007B3E95A|nr:rhamnan synthesis F family protein [Prochlorococcus marinus]KZR78354.1 Rhamnan synthesis protein F [Prochlorococcus marinus str. MIT 1323]